MKRFVLNCSICGQFVGSGGLVVEQGYEIYHPEFAWPEQEVEVLPFCKAHRGAGENEEGAKWEA